MHYSKPHRHLGDRERPCPAPNWWNNEQTCQSMSSESEYQPEHNRNSKRELCVTLQILEGPWTLLVMLYKDAGTSVTECSLNEWMETPEVLMV